ncbi:hypothetical protein J6590_047648 [Homalodisca vitripennis]|nr:hypothetical protein J6590_047648 [Homalodisca vitripennis]
MNNTERRTLANYLWSEKWPERVTGEQPDGTTSLGGTRLMMARRRQNRMVPAPPVAVAVA